MKKRFGAIVSLSQPLSQRYHLENLRSVLNHLQYDREPIVWIWPFENETVYRVGYSEAQECLLKIVNGPSRLGLCTWSDQSDDLRDYAQTR